MKLLSYSIRVGGERVESLTEEQCEKMAQKVGDALSVYYTAHPEEFLKIKD